MKQLKKIGICMDHSIAFLLDLTNGKITQNTITSGFTYEDKKIVYYDYNKVPV